MSDMHNPEEPLRSPGLDSGVRPQPMQDVKLKEERAKRSHKSKSRKESSEEEYDFNNDSEDELSDADEEAEEEPENLKDDYVQDDFVVGDDVGEEGESNRSGEGKKRKHRHHHHSHEHEKLEPEDLELVKENMQNMGMAGELPRPEDEKEFKRLKRSTGPEVPKVRGVVQLERALFGEEEPEGESGKRAERTGTIQGTEEGEREDAEDSSFDSEAHEMDDFIVDNRAESAAEAGDQVHKKGQRRGGRGKVKPALTQVSAGQLQMAEDIFGDALSAAAVQTEQQPAPAEVKKSVSPKKENKLDELYEPQEIVRKYVTDIDQRIKQTDLPERMQIELRDRLNPPLEELQAEAGWILRQRKDKDPSLKDAIFEILKTYRSEHFEMPFIYTYRRHIYKQLFERRDLWNIYRLDKEWGYFTQTKALMQQRLAPILDQYKQFAFVQAEIDTADSLSDLQDVEGFLDFYGMLISAGKGQGLAEQTKVSMKHIQMGKMVQGRIPELAEKVFLRPWELNENLRVKQLVATPPDVKVRLKMLLKEYISEQTKDLIDEERVLAALIKYEAEEIAVLPALKRLVKP